MRQSLAASFLLLIAVTPTALPAIAQVELNPSHPQTYSVRSGDTLWGIAGRFLNEPWRWKELWDANREIRDPNLIYPGDLLHLYYRDGQPRVGLRNRGSGGKPVPTIPLGSIRPFLTKVYVLDKVEIDAAPYVVAFPDEHIVAGVHDYAYVRSIFGADGRNFDIVRPGDAYRDPDSGDILGYKAQFIADAVLERPGDPAKMKITGMRLEAGIGDRVIARSKDAVPTGFNPRPAPQGVQGRIISVLNGVSQIGQYNVVVLNLGKGDGVRPGHVFQVYNGGERVRDTAGSDSFDWDWRNQKFWSQETWFGDSRVKGWRRDGEPGPDFPPHVELGRGSNTVVLPFEQAGTLMVFRVFSGVSFGLIMHATRPMYLLDTVRPPRV